MTKTFNLTGKAYWVKVIGDPVENFREDGNEWTIDVAPNQKGIDLLKRVGLEKNLRDKDDDRGEFITFRRNELKKNGEPNSPIEVVDAEGNPWDTTIGEDGYPVKPIGNESLVKIKFSVFHMPAKGKFKEVIKPVIYKITVLELVEYKKREKVAKADQAGAAVSATVAAEKKIVKKKPAPAAAEEWAGDEEGDE